MSTFPFQLKFPKLGGTVKKLPQGSPVYAKFQDFECEGHIFTAILDDPDDLQDDGLYYFLGVHMVIPRFFAPVDVDPDTGNILSESNDPFGIEINQYFALRMRNVNTNSPLWNGSIQFDLGPVNCGEPGNNGGGSGGEGGEGGLSGNVKFIFDDQGNALPDDGQMRNNIHLLFFKFQHHYFTPVVLSSGLVCYYAFEQKEVLAEWVQKLNSADTYAAAIDHPVILDNILRVPITKKVTLLKYDPIAETYIRECDKKAHFPDPSISGSPD